MSGREADSARDSNIRKQELKSEIKRTAMKKITIILRYAMAMAMAASVSAALPVLAKPPPPPQQFEWNTVVNNNDVMPPSTEKVQQLQPALGERKRAGGHPGPEQRR